jgi:hypothetical protein
MAAIPPTHLRMPQRADAVTGVQPQPGHPIPATVKSDPRIVSQDPVLSVNQTMEARYDASR